MWDLIVSVTDHCLSFYFDICEIKIVFKISHNAIFISHIQILD